MFGINLNQINKRISHWNISKVSFSYTCYVLVWSVETFVFSWMTFISLSLSAYTLIYWLIFLLTYFVNVYRTDTFYTHILSWYETLISKEQSLSDGVRHSHAGFRLPTHELHIHVSCKRSLPVSFRLYSHIWSYCWCTLIFPAASHFK